MTGSWPVGCPVPASEPWEVRTWASSPVSSKPAHLPPATLVAQTHFCSLCFKRDPSQCPSISAAPRLLLTAGAPGTPLWSQSCVAATTSSGGVHCFWFTSLLYPQCSLSTTREEGVLHLLEGVMCSQPHGSALEGKRTALRGNRLGFPDVALEGHGGPCAPTSRAKNRGRKATVAALSGMHLTACDLSGSLALKERLAPLSPRLPPADGHSPWVPGLCEKDLVCQPSAELLSLQSVFLLNPIALFYLYQLFSKRRGRRKVKTLKISR